MKKEIIEELKSGKQFRNPNINSSLIFSPISVDEEKKTIKVNCIDQVTGYSHIEVWNDWDITLNAFLLGEYKFL